MGSSLSDIPGAGGGRRRRRGSASTSGPSGRWRRSPRRSGDDRAGRRRANPRFTPRLEVDRLNLLLASAFAVLLVVGLGWLWRSNRVTLSMHGLDDGGAVTTEAAESLVLDFVVEPSGRVGGAELALDGEDITDEAEETETSLRWSPDPADPLEEGEYEFTLRVPRAVAGEASRTFTVGVDDTAPVLELDGVEPADLGEAVVVTGRVDEEVELRAGDREVEVDDDGSFRIEYEVAPAGVVDLVATDPAGNTATSAVTVPIRYPETHAIHLGADAWADEAVRAAVLDQMGSGFDAVVLDVKDECGLLGGPVDVDLAREIGAVTDRYDLEEAATAIREAGGRPIARVVAFRDPVLTAWAWSSGRPHWVLQDTSSSPWPDFTAPEGCPDPGVAPPLAGGAAAFADPEVQEYLLAVVRAAGSAGFDDILLDDVRRPGGDLANLKLEPGVPSGEEPDEDVPPDPVADPLTDFLERARGVARSEGAYLGVTASGLSVRDPSVFGQDLARFATAVDYIAPEVYPESYSSGFFNLASPVDAPGQAVAGALGEARDQIGGVVIALVPWIQDYSGVVPYGAAEVQAQIDGAAQAGSCSYIREDPARSYTAGVEPAC